MELTQEYFDQQLKNLATNVGATALSALGLKLEDLEEKKSKETLLLLISQVKLEFESVSKEIKEVILSGKPSG